MALSIIPKNKALAFASVVAVLLLIVSCEVADPDPQPGSGKGKVALFITDNLAYYKQVVATITGVRMVNSGTGEVCEVLTAPVTYDISNLSDLAQYTGLADCPAGRYNRVDVDVRRDVLLMDEQDAASPCTFTEFLDENGGVRPLACDETTGICTLSVRGGRRVVYAEVQEDRYNDLGIDFDLKQFTVAGFGNPGCSVVMGVSMKSAVEMNDSGRAHSVTGVMTGLDTTADTFTMVSSGVSLTVDYSGILPSLQPNIDDLLVFARAEGLAVNVLMGGIEIETGSIAANRIYVKAAGTVAKVVGAPKWSFDLEYKPAGVLLAGFDPPADVQGSLSNGVWVNVKFGGYDIAQNTFFAASVEVLPQGLLLED